MRWGGLTNLQWNVGLDWQRYGFSVPSGSPIPTTLQSLALNLGVNWTIADKWNLRLQMAPGASIMTTGTCCSTATAHLTSARL